VKQLFTEFLKNEKEVFLMRSYSCSWHNEYYRKALRNFHNRPDECIGWLEWFEENHSELYKKFERAIRRIHELWGDMSPKAIDNFKKAVKVEIDAMRWAVNRFIEEKEKQAA
jgi:hypothetical protein